MMPNKLNLDLLHSATELILSGSYRHQSQGKTVAYIQLMLGEVELGGRNNHYMYIGETSGAVLAARKAFAAAAKALIPTAIVDESRSANTLYINDQRFFFTPIEMLIEAPKWGGFISFDIDRIFMDISDETQQRLDRDGSLTKTFERLMFNLRYRQGDVI